MTTAISTLFFWCGPATVAWFVVAVWIGITVESFALRPRPHISQEVLEYFPPLAYFDAASAVKSKMLVFLVVAARKHAAPAIPFRPDLAVTAGTVSETGGMLLTSGAFDAAATDHSAATQIAAANGNLPTAITDRFPEHTVNMTQCCYLAKPLSCHVYERVRHRLILPNLREV